MSDSIDEYLGSLLVVVADCPIVSSSNISLDRRGLQLALIRGDLYFADGSRLHFRELVEAEPTLVRHMYSYHYQSPDDSLVFRYDDTPHHANLPNAPHHKHVATEAHVTPSASPQLSDVLREIEQAYPAVSDRAG